MPGDDWQKFANVRLLYSYMICQPGKKLLFMGGEIGQWKEWQCKEELDWQLLQYDTHKKLHHCFKELNLFYQDHPSLWEKDFDSQGFEWIDFHDSANSVLSYLRKSSCEVIICVHNFTPNYFKNYVVRYTCRGSVREIFNTDREEFGGSGKINQDIHRNIDPQGDCFGFTIELAPLATMIFRIEDD